MSVDRPIRVLLIGPPDVNADVDAVQQLLRKINSEGSTAGQMLLEVQRWDTEDPLRLPRGADTGFGGLDLVIAVFASSLGRTEAAPVTQSRFARNYEEYGGTGRPVFLIFFRKNPAQPRTARQAVELGDVLAFRESHSNDQVWQEYRNAADLVAQTKRAVMDHLISRAAATRATAGAHQDPCEGEKKHDMTPSAWGVLGRATQAVPQGDSIVGDPK